MLRLDLHVHSRASPDAKGSLMELAEAAKQRGLQGFAITDHDAVPDPAEIAEVQAATGQIILPGAEWSTIEGHLLSIGCYAEITEGMSMQEATYAIEAAGGIAVPSHPLRLMTGAGPSVLRSLKPALVEGRNGRDRKLVQDNTMKLAESLGAATIGGTDAHWVTDIGTAYTMVDAEPTVDAIMHALRGGHCAASGGSLSRRSLVGHSLKRLKPNRRKSDAQ
ncbi:MAG: PHP domain-containing protein [Thermoplasmatota archaeon]